MPTWRMALQKNFFKDGCAGDLRQGLWICLLNIRFRRHAQEIRIRPIGRRPDVCIFRWLRVLTQSKLNSGTCARAWLPQSLPRVKRFHDKQLIASHVSNGSLRRSMPRLHNSWNYQIGYSKTYKAFLWMWARFSQSNVDQFEFTIQTPPIRGCPNCLWCVQHSTVSRQRGLPLCIALKALLKENRKWNRT